MGKIPIKRDDAEYAKLLKWNGPNREKTVTESELKAASAYIVTGMKTARYGGGESPVLLLRTEGCWAGFESRREQKTAS
jgi:hypothetical protein